MKSELSLPGLVCCCPADIFLLETKKLWEILLNKQMHSHEDLKQRGKSTYLSEAESETINASNVILQPKVINHVHTLNK